LNLKAALAITLRRTEKRGSMPILACALFRIHAGRLEVVGSDLETFSRYELDAVILAPGDPFAVPAKTLATLVGKLSPEVLELGHHPADGMLQIHAPESALCCHLATTPGEEYPSVPAVDRDDRETIDIGPALALCSVIPAMSKDETRYNLNGVHVTQERARVRWEATDGHRLSVATPFASMVWPFPVYETAFDEKVEPREFQGAILPAAWVLEFQKLSGAKKPLGLYWTVRQDDTHVEGTLGPVTVVGRLVEGKFPDTAQVIPENRGECVEVNRKELLQKVEAVSLLSVERSHAVKFRLVPQGLEISSNNPDLGSACDRLDFTYNGPEIEVGFNAKYVKDALRDFDADKVAIRLNEDPTAGPLRIDAEGAPHFCVLMPMRL
jgi:DNA polymerase-3 subunit beta